MRSGYTDECDGRELTLWRGAVRSAICGKRGQAFLLEMLAALDALPKKKLAAGVLVDGAECCAIGAVALARGQDVSEIEEYDRDDVAQAFGIAPALAAEIAYENDERGRWRETPEERFARVRTWVVKALNGDVG